MNQYLNRGILGELGADLPVGERIHVNHEDCPAGTDTRQRLYIYRPDQSTILGYCHHCGQKGLARPGTPTGRRPQGATARPMSITIDDYWHYETDPKTKWTAQAVAWLYKARFTDEMIQENGIRFDMWSGRVALPIFDDCGNLLAMQLRGFDSEKPKYLNVFAPQAIKPVHAFCTPHDHPRIYIVEDILSMIRVSKYDNAMALLGTNLSDWAANHLIEMYKDVYLWLDPDDAGKEATAKIRRRLVPIVSGMIVTVTTDLQPKEMSDDLIRMNTAH